MLTLSEIKDLIIFCRNHGVFHVKAGEFEVSIAPPQAQSDVQLPSDAALLGIDPQLLGGSYRG